MDKLLVIEAIIRTRSGGALPWIKPSATVILRPAPPNQLRGRVPIRRRAFQARRILRRSRDEGFAFNSTTRTIASHRESFRQLQSARIRAAYLKGFGPRARLAHVLTGIPRCAAEALTAPDGIRSRSLPYLARGSEDDCERLRIERQGSSVEGD